MAKIFVYGTLMCLADDQKEYKAKGRLYDGQYFPLAKFNEKGEITGKILQVEDKDLANLDRFEGVGQGLYCRIEITVTDGENHLTVWAYEFKEKIRKGWNPLIKSGKWENKVPTYMIGTLRRQVFQQLEMPQGKITT